MMINPSALGAMLFLCTIIPSETFGAVIASWDWNDGQTDGWVTTSNGTVSNIAGQLQTVSTGNGSLQIFSPDLSPFDLTGLTGISFDLTITSYSAVSSPSDLTNSRLILQTANPLDPVSQPLYWDVDLSGLAFGQMKTFELPVQDAFVSGSLASVVEIDFSLADPAFDANTSSALLDNFVILGPTQVSVPEPSSFSALTLMSVAVGLFATFRKWTSRG